MTTTVSVIFKSTAEAELHHVLFQIKLVHLGGASEPTVLMASSSAGQSLCSAALELELDQDRGPLLRTPRVKRRALGWGEGSGGPDTFHLPCLRRSFCSVNEKSPRHLCCPRLERGFCDRGLGLSREFPMAFSPGEMPEPPTEARQRGSRAFVPLPTQRAATVPLGQGKEKGRKVLPQRLQTLPVPTDISQIFLTQCLLICCIV